jgi:hypothetical protein
LTQADLTRLGLDQDKLLALKKLAQDKSLTEQGLAVERLKASKMGSGGGSSNEGGDIFLT